MPSFQYGTTHIEYTLQVKEGKKDVSISVDQRDGVQVFIPPTVTPETTEEILRKKAPWILSKLNELAELCTETGKREFLSGEKLPYLGRNYRLKVFSSSDASDAKVRFQNGRFVAEVPPGVSETWKQHRLRESFKQWYIQHGTIKVQERIQLFAPRMECLPSKLVIKDQENRWGSCTKNGTININWKILMAPMRIVDYVVVHELAHLKYPDHSSSFWSAVQSVLPDYDNRKEWLRIHGPTLTF